MPGLRFALIGSGYMARTHGAAIRQLGPDARLVALAGGSRAPRLAALLECTWEENIEALVARDDIDAVVVTTPHHLHATHAIQALAAGKHVLVEKPMATTVEDCDRMIAAARRSGRHLAVAYNLRFRHNPPVARALIAEHAIGRVIALHFSMLRSLDENLGETKVAWLNLPETVGNLIDALPHGLDLIRWLTGAEVISAAGFCRSFLLGRPIEDTTVGILEFSNGAVGSITTTAATAGPYPREEARLGIIGSAGTLDLDCFGDLHLSDRKDGWRLVATQPKVDYANPDLAFSSEGRMKAFRDQILSFIEGARGGPTTAGSGADGRADVAACLALLSSSLNRRFVPPTPPG